MCNPRGILVRGDGCKGVKVGQLARRLGGIYSGVPLDPLRPPTTPHPRAVAQIPTFHAKPLHPECDTWCDFPVADRPNAVQQWVSAVKADPSLIQVQRAATLYMSRACLTGISPPGSE